MTCLISILIIEGPWAFRCLLVLKARAIVWMCFRASLSGSRLARAINSFRRLGQGVGKVDCCPVLDLEKPDFKRLLESQNRTDDFYNRDMRAKSRNCLLRGKAILMI